MGCALFVGGQNVTDFFIVSMELELVVDLQDRAAGIAKDGINALLQQTLHHDLGCFHFHSVDTSKS